MKTRTKTLALLALAGGCIASSTVSAADTGIAGKWRCNPPAQDAVEQAGRSLDERIAGINTGMAFVLTGRVEIEGGGRLPVGHAAPIAGEPNPPALLRFQALRVNGTAGPAATVRSDGVFVLALPDGKYRIVPAVLPLGYYVKSMSYGAVDLLRSPLKVTDASSSEIHATLAAAPREGVSSGATVTGVVSGLPPAGSARPTWISLSSAAPSRDLLGRALKIVEQPVVEEPLGADGTFEFRNVPSGTYTVWTLGPALPRRAIQTIVVADRDLRLTLATAPRGGGVAGRGAGGGRGGRGGGGGGGAGGGRSSVLVLPSSRLGPPLTLDLKLDKDNRLTGSVTFLRTASVFIQQFDVGGTSVVRADQKYKVEVGTVAGNTFTFQTYEEIDKRRLVTLWKGELTDDATMVAVRLLPGEPSATPNLTGVIQSDGPDAFLFRRTK